MTYGILITARLKSKRLKKKIIRKINQNTLISFLIQRLKLEFNKNKIILITSRANQDKKLIQISNKEKIYSYAGEPKDVLKRIYNASKKFRFKNIISCTADNPFIDTMHAKKMMNLHIKKKNDLTIMNGLPIGLFSYAIRVKALKKVIKLKASNDTETWIPYFTEADNFKVGTYKIKLNYKNRDKLRLTVDTKEDLKLIRQVLNLCKSYQPTTNQILSVFKKYPNLIKINSNIKQKKVSKPKFNL